MKKVELEYKIEEIYVLHDGAKFDTGFITKSTSFNEKKVFRYLVAFKEHMHKTTRFNEEWRNKNSYNEHAELDDIVIESITNFHLEMIREQSLSKIDEILDLCLGFN